MSSHELVTKWTSGQPWFSIIKYWIYSPFASFLDDEMFFTFNSGICSPIYSKTEQTFKNENISILQQIRLAELSDLKYTVQNLKKQLQILKSDISLIKSDYIILERNHIQRETYTKKIKKISEYSLQDILMDDDSICSSSTGYYSIEQDSDNNRVTEYLKLDSIGLNLNIIQK
ncbi:hypothetical protein C6P45_004614 [Maudiozyma exigua]|uniref:Uncharacterized protein n=1 Tax=Maudiozyma exigua TaxID=34358 RepID=A0A9P7BBM1_MAUEX|nr:hypothetical protein C6P45_004614 [Kazachstania exigua]